MKKKIYLLSTALMLTLSASQLRAATVITEPVAKEMTATDVQNQAKLEAIKERLSEIKAMDKSQLTKEQKQDLKAELKTMKAEARAAGGGGIYLSVGAIVIIILLLILILR